MSVNEWLVPSDAFLPSSGGTKSVYAVVTQRIMSVEANYCIRSTFFGFFTKQRSQKTK
jgi:hypothetical protein